MLGGDIAVDSQLGAGSTFTVMIPVRVRARAPQYRSDAEHRRQSA
jgi:signal transduction histidine kinase